MWNKGFLWIHLTSFRKIRTFLVGVFSHMPKAINRILSNFLANLPSEHKPENYLSRIFITICESGRFREKKQTKTIYQSASCLYHGFHFTNKIYVALERKLRKRVVIIAAIGKVICLICLYIDTRIEEIDKLQVLTLIVIILVVCKNKETIYFLLLSLFS